MTLCLKPLVTLSASEPQMTVDKSREQIDKYMIGEQSMATTSAFQTTNPFQTPYQNASQESDLSSRLKGLDIKEKHQMIPRRQPTIVCEDIADDIDLDDEDIGAAEDLNQETDQKTGVTRSASSASLTVPQTSESNDEKRRPPLPAEEQMLVESN